MVPFTINVIFQISYMSSKFGHPLLVMNIKWSGIRANQKCFEYI